MATIEDLLSSLKRLESIAEEPKGASANYIIHFSEENQNKGTQPLEDAVSLANELLINTDGSCNWRNMKILQNNLYHCESLEEDRFGWLVAGIETSKGTLVFG
jgi:hypothetical protein